MSAVKTFALGVLLTGTLAAPTLGGSWSTGRGSFESARGRWGTAAENLAGNGPSYGSSNSEAIPYGVFGGGVPSQGGGLVLGTSAESGAINFGNASFRIANSVSGATYAGPAPSYDPSPAPASYTQPSPTPVASPSKADAFINFGNGPYADASSLTTGSPQSFLNSSVFRNLYGSNGPSSQDVANFEAQVVATVQKTYNDAGLSLHLTTDPNAGAAHTLSVVSGATSTDSPGAIGITTVGDSGFSFIDKFGVAKDAGSLAIAIGHNVAHELMHAFGLADHPEATGPYVDAATINYNSLADPNTGFSSAASSLLSTLNFQADGLSIRSGSGAQLIEGDQILTDASTVPEPSTVALWTLLGLAGIAYRRRKSA